MHAQGSQCTVRAEISVDVPMHAQGSQCIAHLCFVSSCLCQRQCLAQRIETYRQARGVVLKLKESKSLAKQNFSESACVQNSEGHSGARGDHEQVGIPSM